MSKTVNKLLPDSFKNRFLALFILFALTTGILSASVQYFYDKKVYRTYASETVFNIHKSVEERLRDAILYDDIYSLFSVAENIAQSVSLVSNVIITDQFGGYITDAAVTKALPEVSNKNTEFFDIKLKNGKPVGRVAYTVDTNEINKTVLTHTLTSLFIILPIVAVFIYLSIRLILYFTKPLNDFSDKLKKTDINNLAVSFELPDYTSKEVRNLSEAFTSLSLELDKSIRVNIDQAKNLANEERLAAIGSMSAGLAHELRNPAMSLQMLMHSISSTEGQIEKQDIDVMNREISRIVSTVGEFLKIAKPINISPAKTSVQTLSNMINEHIARVMKNRINIDIISENFEFCSDEIMLFNIFENLINNSYEAGATKCSVNISKDNDDIIITYRDNGSGVSESIKDKIFRPFFTTKKSGTGLGMSMCEKMLSAMGGSILLVENPENGAGFIVKIKDMT